ncbi:glycosyl transferase family 9 [Desulfurobacterium thermolithotrophum DSM 11699]|uniref:Glycosyl transferase family 9 n=1 Tax=Desulfurobacterium thermolithotrophum (strain DSM 11699 / BSA) TaxID=868864 RepID=F0S1N9_DESTD|nr:glycosyltransferase family 9 protein [Desulfurobacterium thermolithotrophum]ADY72894.1 glycosyl transferase family 9 [Desulfurobacterium thermolithotrophum DSM 11699]
MRILIIRFSSLGDVILVSSVFNSLREKGIEIDLLTYKPFGEVFKGDYRVNKVIEVEKRKYKNLKSLKKLSEKLKDYDYGFDLHGNLRTFFLSRYLPFPVFKYSKKSILRRLMITFKPFKAKWLYVPKMYAETFKKIGVEIENPRPEIPIFHHEVEKVKELLPKSNFAVIAPGARWKTKRYPEENFREIIKILERKDIKTVIVGGKEEKDIGEKLSLETGAINLCGKLSIRESLSVLSLSRGVISNDSAVVHMARAVKKPVIAIFGPTHPAFGFAPYEDEGKAITRNLPCSPCSLHGKTKCKERKCFEIPPSKIVSEFISLVEFHR